MPLQKKCSRKNDLDNVVIPPGRPAARDRALYLCTFYFGKVSTRRERERERARERESKREPLLRERYRERERAEIGEVGSRKTRNEMWGGGGGTVSSPPTLLLFFGPLLHPYDDL